VDANRKAEEGRSIKSFRGCVRFWCLCFAFQRRVSFLSWTPAMLRDGIDTEYQNDCAIGGKKFFLFHECSYSLNQMLLVIYNKWCKWARFFFANKKPTETRPQRSTTAQRLLDHPVYNLTFSNLFSSKDLFVCSSLFSTLSDWSL
jgi:hypothetical protein